MRLFLILICLLIWNVSSAAPDPPPPPAPPLPPGLSVDSMVIVLFLTSIILGFYKIQKFKKRATN